MFMHRNGRWARLINGPKVLKYEDDRLLIIFMIRNQIPPEIRARFDLEPNDDGLYGLELWDKPVGQVSNLVWKTVFLANPNTEALLSAQAENMEGSVSAWDSVPRERTTSTPTRT